MWRISLLLRALGLAVALVAAGCVPGAPDYPVYDCQLREVIDGDSIRARCLIDKTPTELEVRLHCVDAAELGQTPYGAQAKFFLESLLPSQLQITDKGRDRYGRTLGALRSGRKDMQAVLISTGAAVVYRDYCTNRDYLTLEQAARNSRVGVWREAGMHQRPWDWRRRQPEAPQQPEPKP